MNQVGTSGREHDGTDADHLEALTKESAKEAAQQYVDAIANDPRQVREWLGEKDLAYGGLIGIGAVMVQPFIGSAPLDLPGIVCVVAFALAIPLLAALVLLNRQEVFRSRFAHSRLVTVGQALAQGSAVVGVITGFWHIHWVAGAVMLVSVFLAMGVHSAGFMSVEPELGPLVGAEKDHGDG